MKLNVPALLALGAAVIVITIGVLLGLEGVLLLTGQAPITWYTECATAAYPLAMTAGACVVTGGVCALVAHFWWHTR